MRTIDVIVFLSATTRRHHVLRPFAGFCFHCYAGSLAIYKLKKAWLHFPEHLAVTFFGPKMRTELGQLRKGTSVSVIELIVSSRRHP